MSKQRPQEEKEPKRYPLPEGESLQKIMATMVKANDPGLRKNDDKKSPRPTVELLNSITEKRSDQEILACLAKCPALAYHTNSPKLSMFAMQEGFSHYEDTVNEILRAAIQHSINASVFKAIYQHFNANNARIFLKPLTGDRKDKIDILFVVAASRFPDSLGILQTLVELGCDSRAIEQQLKEATQKTLPPRDRKLTKEVKDQLCAFGELLKAIESGKQARSATTANPASSPASK